MGNVVVIIILVLIVSWSVMSIIKRKKAGKLPCGCDCSACEKNCNK